MNKRRKILTILTIFIILFTATAFSEKCLASFKHPYGVFLGVSTNNLSCMDDYKLIVIDASEYTSKQIKRLHEKGHIVYSYINIGSIEDYRDGYEELKDLALGEYENWEGEYWVDASSPRWQRHIKKAAKALKKKGVDGLFADNADVYYFYHKKAIYRGIKKILTGIKGTSLPVIVNGGDVFVRKCISRMNNLPFDGVNQECVLTTISDYENDIFARQDAESEKYFKKYLKKCRKNGLGVYLTEYTKDKSIEEEVKRFANKNGYRYYVSGTVNLEK